MSKIAKEILVKTQNGGAIVGVKNVFLDSSQKDYSITGHIIGEFDDFQYSRFAKCEKCEEEKNCKDCEEGVCYDHYLDRINDPFDSDFCEDCEFENIQETKMMLLARYNFKFEALSVLERLFNAIQVGAKTFSFPIRLEKSHLISWALSNGVIKKEETRFQIGRRKDSKPRQYTMTTYEGLAEFAIFSYFFEVRPLKLSDSILGEWELKFKNENPDLSFSIYL
jgi:hypothetical protein